MTSKDRFALIYATSILGAGSIAFARGKRNPLEILSDAVIHGVVAGTVLNAASYAYDLYAGDAEAEEGAEANGEGEGLLGTLGGLLGRSDITEGMGTVPAAAIKVLANVNARELLRPMKKSGVKIAEAPEDPYQVVQDED